MALSWIGTETAPENAWRVFHRKGSFGVRVHFLEPFDPGEHPHRKAISAQARTRIAAALSGQPQPVVPPFTPGVTNATPRYLKLSAEGDVSMICSRSGGEGRREREKETEANDYDRRTIVFFNR